MQIDLMDVHEGWKLVRPEFKIDYRAGATPRAATGTRSGRSPTT
jgi:hypothetical protein